MVREGEIRRPNGMPADFIAVATDKMARINAAYDIIRRERKLA